MKNLNVIMILIDGARLDHVQKSDYYQKLKSDFSFITLAKVTIEVYFFCLIDILIFRYFNF